MPTLRVDEDNKHEYTYTMHVYKKYEIYNNFKRFKLSILRWEDKPKMFKSYKWITLVIWKYIFTHAFNKQSNYLMH